MTDRATFWIRTRRNLAARDIRRSVSLALALAILFSSLSIIMAPNATGSIFTDLSSPNATFRDVVWHEDGEYAMVVGNDSSSNGVAYRYGAAEETWDQLMSVPGDSYNAVTKTEEYAWWDTFEDGENGWTTNTWEETPTSSLVGEWKFDEGYGQYVNDTSTKNNVGELRPIYPSNVPTWTADGFSNSALYFDGLDDRVETDYIPNTFNLHDHSIKAWVYPTIDKTNSVIYGIGETGINGKNLELKIDSGELQIWHWGWNWYTGITIDINKWTHIAYTYTTNNKTGNVYVNGQYIDSFVYGGYLNILNDANIPSQIGMSLAGRNFKGFIDEVQIYNRTLTTTEISSYYDLTGNKIGEWSFEEGAGTFTEDATQHSNDGTLINMEEADWVTGPSGQALIFDGLNEYIRVDDEPSLNLTSTFTLEAWIYMVNGGKWQCVVAKANLNTAADISYHWRVSMTNQVQVFLSNGVTSENVFGNTPLQEDTWHHIAVVATGSQYKFYLNGQPDGTFPQTYSPQIISAPLRIGSHGNTHFFDGAIDEVNIWDCDLSDADIQNHYERYLNNYYDNLTRVGDWDFDEGAGFAVNDDSIYGNDGSLVNMEGDEWVGGISGDALELDGVDEYVSIPHSPSLDITDEVTIEAFIKPVESFDYYGIVSKRTAAGDIQYYFRIFNDNLEFYYTFSGGAHVFRSDHTVILNEWQHVAMTYKSGDGSSAKIYLNGVLASGYWSSGDGLSPLESNAADVWIGACEFGDYYFNGTMDNVKIHSRILNQSEISESYNGAFSSEWHLVDPATLPDAGSGTSHGTAKSPDNIWWFGDATKGNYDNGERVMGSLVSPPKYLPSISNFGLVVFNHWFDIESAGPDADIMSVSIKNTTDSEWYLLKTWDSESIPISDWQQEIIYVSGWCGNTVQVKFTFDSDDGSFNDFAGWHIDDFAFYTNGAYVVVGDIPTGAGYSAYSVDLGSGYSDIDGMDFISFNDVAAGLIPATFLAVGDSGQGRYWDGAAWNTITGIDGGDTLTGIDFNGTHFVIVGYDLGGAGVSYYITEAEVNVGSYVVHAIANVPNVKLNSIEWHNYVNGGLVCAEGAMYFLNSTWEWKGPIGIDPSMNYTASSWSPDGSRAIIVGNTGIGSAAFDIYAGNTEITQIPDYDHIFQSHKLYGAAYQPIASGNTEVLLIGASAFKIYPKALAQNTQVLINVNYPNLFDIDFYKTSNPGTSLVNKQVDVQETYTFRTEVNYSVSGIDRLFDGINNTAIDLMVWYDDAGANELTLPGMDDVHRTRYFNVTWFEGDGGANLENAIVTYPIASPGTNEFQLMGFSSGPAGGDHWWIELEIYFGPQTRAADGQGFVNGDSTNESDISQSFTDPDSWNFMMEIYDTTFTTASSKGYEEFGVFKYTNITVSGNPAGNAPPGSNDNSMGSSLVTYMANVPHYVNVSIPDLARIGGGGSIPATNIAAYSASPLANNTNCGMNSTWTFGRPFPGANQNLSIWGNTSQPIADWDLPAPENGTTAHGPWGSDFNSYGATVVNWYSSVPGGTLEGIYQATITFKIGYY